MSRNMVDRMVEKGELPSVILREGTRQRMIRVPKRFIINLLADLDAGARISLREYVALWQASAVARSETVFRAGAPVSVEAE